MDIPLLLSGLNDIPSFSDPIKDLFDKNESIKEINSDKDINALLDLGHGVMEELLKINFVAVDINVMAIHAQVIKPFISQADAEDDFI